MSVIDPFVSNTPPGVVRMIGGPNTTGPTPAPQIPPPEPVVTPTPTVPTNPFGPKPQLTDAQHLQNFMYLWKINSQAAYDYLSKGGAGSGSWGQRNQNWMRDNLFNGDQYALNQWKNDSSYHVRNMYAQADPGFEQQVLDLANGKFSPTGKPWDPTEGVTPWVSGSQFNPFATAPGGGGGGYAPGGSPGTQPTPFVPSFGYNPNAPGYHGVNNYDPTTGTYNASNANANTAEVNEPVFTGTGGPRPTPRSNIAPTISVPTTPVNPLPTTPVNPHGGRTGYRYRAGLWGANN